MKISNIVWDTEDNGEVLSPEELGLPTEVELDEDIDPDEVAAWLSDEYGWCVVGFDVAESRLTVFRQEAGIEPGYYQAIRFWSNGLGELQIPGGRDIEEDELPAELKRAYDELYFEGGYGGLRYLVDTDRGYGIALISEYNAYTAELSGLSMEALFETVVADAQAIVDDPLFANAEVFVGEFMGFDECHDLTVVFPADTTVEEFRAAAKRLDKMVYKACGLTRPKSIDGQLLDAGSRSDLSAPKDGGRLSPHELKMEN